MNLTLMSNPLKSYIERLVSEVLATNKQFYQYSESTTPSQNSLLLISDESAPGHITKKIQIGTLFKSGSYAATPSIISGISDITRIQSYYMGAGMIGAVVIAGVQCQITMSATEGVAEFVNPITPNFSSGVQAFLLGGAVHKKDNEAQGDGEILDLLSNPANNKTTMRISTSTTGDHIVCGSWFYIISSPTPEKK